MGALFGFFDTVGRHMQEQNRVELEHQTKANAEMADMLDNLAKTAKPQYAPDYFRAAMQIRMTPPGKKPPKEATDIYSLMLRQVKRERKLIPVRRDSSASWSEERARVIASLVRRLSWLDCWDCSGEGPDSLRPNKPAPTVAPNLPNAGSAGTMNGM